MGNILPSSPSSACAGVARFFRGILPAVDLPKELPSSAAPASAPAPGAEEYQISLDNPDAWLKHLRTHGYVVVRQAMSKEDVQTAKDLLWRDLKESFEVERQDVSTWGVLGPTNGPGIVAKIAQRWGAWHVRGSAGVKSVFASIWETSDLIVSMDCALVWLPWWIKEAASTWKPDTEGLHLDQNPFTKPGLHCVQGMVPLLPVTRVTGGLQVVPGSHTDEAKEAQKRDYPHLAMRGDWCPLHTDDIPGAKPLLAEPGDLILWDSRTIHGGLVGTGEAAEGTASDELARMSVAVSMTPRAWASEAVLKARRRGFQRMENFNHSPHEAGTSTGTIMARPKRGLQPIELTEEQRALL